MRTAIVKAKKVINVVIVNGEWEPPKGTKAIPSEEAGIGWRYDGKKFTPPPENPQPKPDDVTSLEVRAVAAILIDKGVATKAEIKQKFKQLRDRNG